MTFSFPKACLLQAFAVLLVMVVLMISVVIDQGTAIS